MFPDELLLCVSSNISYNNCCARHSALPFEVLQALTFFRFFLLLSPSDVGASKRHSTATNELPLIFIPSLFHESHKAQGSGCAVSSVLSLLRGHAENIARKGGGGGQGWQP